MNESEFARREAEEINAENNYFDARPELDTQNRRRVFEAGFIRGYDSVCPKHPQGVTAAQIDSIVNGMPGGIDGFLKEWGWQQFAQAIEEAQGIGV